jgi:hypothetical protein
MKLPYTRIDKSQMMAGVFIGSFSLALIGLSLTGWLLDFQKRGFHQDQLFLFILLGVALSMFAFGVKGLTVIELKIDEASVHYLAKNLLLGRKEWLEPLLNYESVVLTDHSFDSRLAFKIYLRHKDTGKKSVLLWQGKFDRAEQRKAGEELAKLLGKPLEFLDLTGTFKSPFVQKDQKSLREKVQEQEEPSVVELDELKGITYEKEGRVYHLRARFGKEVLFSGVSMVLLSAMSIYFTLAYTPFVFLAVMALFFLGFGLFVASIGMWGVEHIKISRYDIEHWYEISGMEFGEQTMLLDDIEHMSITSVQKSGQAVLSLESPEVIITYGMHLSDKDKKIVESLIRQQLLKAAS